MKHIKSIQLMPESREEILPGVTEKFPYLASCAYLSRYPEPGTPWHWHRSAELFYIEQGILEYQTPEGKKVFPAGTGGFVNSNVLHSSRVMPSGVETVQLLHLFEPELLSDGNSLIGEKYIRPLTQRRDVELMALSPEDPFYAEILRKIRSAFDLKEDSWGYEIHLRRELTQIWLSLLELAGTPSHLSSKNPETDEKLKKMMGYIQAHYPQTITVEMLAKQAHISKRVCYRIFKETLQMSPVEYMTDFRIRKACLRLTESADSITKIAYDCGLGSSSYFGKLFRERMGCTPVRYRKKWHDREK